MLICKVVKPLVSTNRIPGFEHKHLQVVLDGSSKKVAVDAVGCKPGDWVICVGSSAAREAAGSKSYPSDLTIVGIIDHWDPENPKSWENRNYGNNEGSRKDGMYSKSRRLRSHEFKNFRK